MAGGHREVETKYDVDDATALPELADLPDVTSVQGPRTFQLEATYFDTEDLALGRHGITLRRRTGGVDEGWHLKLPTGGARQEIRATLGRSTTTPPISLRRIVQGVVRDQRLVPVVVVNTNRTVAALFDADEDLLAEVCDDRVVASRGAQGGEEQYAWREWEVEEHAARRRLTKAIDARMRKAGARAATHRSKFERVMQIDVEPVAQARPPVRRRASERELLGRRVAVLRLELVRLDPLVRADVPDAVHQMRVTCRRLRALLASFEKCFDRSRTEPVRDELAWLGEILGRPRDLEVLRMRLGELVLALPANVVRGRPGPWIDSRLRAAHRAAHKEALDAMQSDRYYALVDALDTWRIEPPWSEREDRPATKRLPKMLDRDWQQVERAAAAARGAGDADRPALLHDVRKAAKRVRYAAETLLPVVGADAGVVARSAKEIQTVLGDHHDAVVASERVRELAAQADGQIAFTLGMLHARLVADRCALEAEFERIWTGFGRRL